MFPVVVEIYLWVGATLQNGMVHYEISHILWVYGCSILGSHSRVFYKELTCSASGMERCPPEAVSRQECLSPPVRFSLKSSPHKQKP